MLKLVLLAVVANLIAATGFAQSGNCTRTDISTRPDCSGALAFFRTLQLALKKNDKEKVASLVSYPLLTMLNHRQVRIRNRNELLVHFDEVFDNGVRCVILNATEQDVWGNWRGFTVDGGAIWFDGIIPRGENPDTEDPNYWKKYPFKIITINNDGSYSCKVR